jgi:signal transduction histidine kinase
LNHHDYTGKPISDTLTNGFFTVNKQWTVLYWNKAAEKLLGVSANEIIGNNLWKKFADTIPIEFYSVYQNAFLQDIPLHFEEYWGEMGAWFDVVTYHCDDILSVSFKSSNMPHAGYPENAYQRLMTLTELYRFVTEITNDCLWEWDLQTKEMFWIDGGHKRVFGYHVVNALIPQSFWENCIHPDDKGRVLDNLDTYMQKRKDEIWGHIIFINEVPARMIGATQDITRRVMLEKKLAQERKDRQSEITDAVLLAQESERENIGKEMHDNVNQVLGASKLYIEMARANLNKMDIYLVKSADYITHAIEELRKLSKILIPPGMQMLGLVGSIQVLVDDLKATHPIKLHFDSNGIILEDIPEKMQLNIFRMVQELLNNVLKHAKATRANIKLSRTKDEIKLVVSDNGMGCKLNILSKGVGIRNITSRAELFNGTVHVVSMPGEGYELTVLLPL